MNAVGGPVAFGTKAETLQRLAPRLTRSYVLPLVAFPVGEWRGDAGQVLGRIADELGDGQLIVRSSAKGEDSVAGSMAGAYTTIANVEGGDEPALRAAIDSVVSAYGDGRDDHQVLVQHQLTDVRMSAVLLGRDLTTLGPYRVLNYDDRSHRTDTVTSGRSDGLRTYVRLRGVDLPYPNADIAALFEAFDEIEALLGDPIEAEMAITDDGRVCLFQARPIAVAGERGADDATVAAYLDAVADKVAALSGPHPYLHGSRSVFGVMPDWNPAEIIGVKPRALALSLYKELVTDSIWAYMRDNYGYRNLRSFPLLVSFLGVPFIDVRVSFNSFVPKRVREPLSKKLVDYYIDRLVETPHAHDKVEFDIVFSCYYPGIARRIAVLGEHGFDGFEIGELLAELRVLTNDIMHPTRGYWSQDLAKIEELKVRQRRVVDSDMSSIDKIYWLLEDCKRYGTLPFSGLARAGFIAIQYLKGLVDTGVIGEADYHAFLGSLNTVTEHMSDEVRRLGNDESARAAFLERYGHLRPGTYDILSPRYDEDFERYFATGGTGTGQGREVEPFELRPDVERALAAMLASEGLELTPSDLLAFMRAGIEGREYAKLVFTRSLSDALVEIEKLGAACGLSREEMSFVDIRTIQRLYASLDATDLRDILLRDIEANRKAYDVTRIVRLPDLMIGRDDVFHFHLAESRPNFVTLRSVTAGIVREETLDGDSLADRIVFIRSADPGYDWIFTRRIGGLVTQFGGANSHMAIRAAEQGVPAIIGCGERNFEAWSRANMLEIDCAAQTVRILQ